MRVAVGGGPGVGSGVEVRSRVGSTVGRTSPTSGDADSVVFNGIGIGVGGKSEPQAETASPARIANTTAVGARVFLRRIMHL